MGDWRKTLQSKAMRNLTLAIFVANAGGIYAVQVRMSEQAADVVDAADAPPTLAEREIGAGLATLPSPPRVAAASTAPQGERLASAISRVTSEVRFRPDTRFTPDAQARALPTGPSEPEFAVVARHADDGGVRVAAVSPRLIARDASASFNAAFSGMSAGAPTGAADLDVAPMASQADVTASTVAVPAVSVSTLTQPSAAGAPQGGVDLPPLEDHTGTAGAARTPASDAPAPSAAGGAAPPNVMLGA